MGASMHNENGSFLDFFVKTNNNFKNNMEQRQINLMSNVNYASCE